MTCCKSVKAAVVCAVRGQAAPANQRKDRDIEPRGLTLALALPSVRPLTINKCPIK